MKYLVLSLLMISLVAAAPQPAQRLTGLAAREAKDSLSSLGERSPQQTCTCKNGAYYCCLGAPTFAYESTGPC